MNVVDIAFALILLAALGTGLQLGLIRQICLSAGLLAGSFAAAFLCQFILPAFSHHSLRVAVVLLLTFGSLALCFALANWLGNWVAGKNKKLPSLKLLDQGLGIIFGGATALFMLWLVFPLLSNVPSAKAAQTFGSSRVSALMDDLPQQPQVVARLSNLVGPLGSARLFADIEPIPKTLTIAQSAEVNAALSSAGKSMAKVHGEACGSQTVGSGFFIKPDIIATNAHVVSGMDYPFVHTADGSFPAQVVWFDPNNDIALLQTTTITSTPLEIITEAQTRGTLAGVLGYPAAGDLKGNEAIILDRYQARGYNIYNTKKIIREIYSVQSNIQPGNSGGPVVNKEGQVIGLIFGHSTEHPGIGYALTAKRVKEALDLAAKQQFAAVGSGECY